METYYLNLIAKSYIKLTKENNDNLALFYYKKSSKQERKNKTPKNRFYNKLIKNIENLINNSYTKAKAPDLSGIPDEHRIDQENELKRKEFNYFAAMDQYSDYCAEEGLPNNTPNWEICTDATKLTNALNNEYVKLKDPINIITPSKKTSKKELIVRKSKLEYLKSEAERASKVSSIDELNEIPAIETPIPSALGINVSKSDNDIKIAIQNAFKFTLTNIPGKKQILSQQDYDRLVIWVTAYFENGFEIPEINEPIKEMNTTKGNITHVFIDLFTELFPSRAKSKPQNYYELIKRCFYKLRDDKISNISKGKKSLDYDKIIKQTPKI